MIVATISSKTVVLSPYSTTSQSSNYLLFQDHLISKKLLKQMFLLLIYWSAGHKILRPPEIVLTPPWIGVPPVSAKTDEIHAKLPRSLPRAGPRWHTRRGLEIYPTDSGKIQKHSSKTTRCCGKLLFILHDTEMTIPLLSIAILVVSEHRKISCKSKILLP